jgi:activator of 2-hydroxyglutaryl-CoA dehydratase
MLAAAVASSALPEVLTERVTIVPADNDTSRRIFAVEQDVRELFALKAEIALMRKDLEQLAPRPWVTDLMTSVRDAIQKMEVSFKETSATVSQQAVEMKVLTEAHRALIQQRSEQEQQEAEQKAELLASEIEHQKQLHRQEIEALKVQNEAKLVEIRDRRLLTRIRKNPAGAIGIAVGSLTILAAAWRIIGFLLEHLQYK